MFRVSFTFHRMTEYIKCVSYIFTTRTPFKIFYSIVCLISVDMVYLFFIFGIWNKSISNKSMYLKPLLFYVPSSRQFLDSHRKFSQGSSLLEGNS